MATQAEQHHSTPLFGENPDIHGPITEPVITPGLFVSGMDIQIIDGVAHLTGWYTVKDDGFHGSPERRVICRLILSNAPARALANCLRAGLAMGGH